MLDFDINQCMDSKDVHSKLLMVFSLYIAQMMKGFDNYLSMVSQLYYGLPIPQHFGGKGGKNESSTSSLPGNSANFSRKQQSLNAGQMSSNDSNQGQNGGDIDKPNIT